MDYGRGTGVGLEGRSPRDVDITSQDMEQAMARSENRFGYMSTRNQSVAYNTLKQLRRN